jgi:hypothetical protein
MAAIFEARGGDSRVETAIALPPPAVFFAAAAATLAGCVLPPPAAFLAAAAATLAGCVVLTATLRAPPLRGIWEA